MSKYVLYLLEYNSVQTAQHPICKQNHPNTRTELFFHIPLQTFYSSHNTKQVIYMHLVHYYIYRPSIRHT